MCGNKTHGIYQNRYRKATLSSLGDMMTRTYANKNNRAVLKQEMKTCNITKTFPRADIRARCQLLKTTVTDSAVAAQHRGSCAETDCIREGRTRLGGRRTKNQIFRKLPQKVKSTSTGEIRHPECSPPQRQTPNFSHWIHRNVGVPMKNSWLFFIPLISFNEHALFIKIIKGQRPHWTEPYLSPLFGLLWGNAYYAHTVSVLGEGHCWTMYSFVLGLRPQMRVPSRRNALGAVLSVACLIQSPLSYRSSTCYLRDRQYCFTVPAS